MSLHRHAHTYTTYRWTHAQPHSFASQDATNLSSVTSPIEGPGSVYSDTSQMVSQQSSPIQIYTSDQSTLSGEPEREAVCGWGF